MSAATLFAAGYRAREAASSFGHPRGNFAKRDQKHSSRYICTSWECAMGIIQRVFVDVEAGQFHAELECPHARRVRHWCAAVAAHRSYLHPCPHCAPNLVSELRSAVGSIPSGARKSLGLPRLQTLTGRGESEQSADDEAYDLHYGAPETLDDPRFSTRSLIGWGTASFGQDPSEYLGDPTDDDNDWRGGSRMHD